jgi:hypothetical protein
MIARIALALALVACGSRTEIVFGVATDLRAPDALDTVTLEVKRVDNGVPQQQLVWQLSGQINEPFNLPGSFGVFSDGDEITVDATLSGLKNEELIVSRHSILTLVEGQTLFYRMGLTAGCIDRLDCPSTSTCIEGVCRDVNVPTKQLPDFDQSLVTELTCAAGASYIDTGTGDPMPLSDDAAACPAGQCLEGTCLKPPPAEGGTRTVRGSRILTFVLPNNQLQTEAVDFSVLGVEIAALVSDGAGGFTTFPGTGNSDGTFSIPDVPRGTYTLKVGTDFTVSTSDNVDLGSVELGRPNATRTAVIDATTTGFSLNVDSMSGWADGNLLSAYAPDVNAWWFVFHDGLAGPPTLGQTSLAADVTYEMAGGAAFDLIQGEPFALLQYTNQTASDGTTQYQTPTKILVPPPVTIVEGQLTPITGSFSNIVPTETVSLDVRQLEFENTVGWDGTHPNLLNPTAVPIVFAIGGVTASDGGVGIDIFGQPGGLTYGQFSATLDYLFIAAPEGKNTLFADLLYSKPHISQYAFGQMLSAGITYQVQYQLPGTTNPTNQFITISTLRAADTDLLIVAPILGPVREAQIEGRDIFTPQQGVPSNSRITWKAPATGNASMYTLNFFRLGVNPNNNNTNKTQVAFVRTTDTFFEVPPGVLEVGQSYYVIITSTLDGNIDAPKRQRLPEAFTPIASGTFTVGAGDGSGSPDTGGGGGGGPLIDAGVAPGGAP